MKTNKPFCHCLIVCTALVLLSGCNPAPPALIEPTIELSGTPNETVIFSAKNFVFKSTGRSTSSSGSSSYGPVTLDENGKHTFEFEEPIHGFRYRLVTLNDNQVTMTAKLKNGTQLSQHVVSGRLEHATAEHGKTSNGEPRTPFHDSPEDTVYEAEQYLKSLNKSDAE